MSWGIRKAAGRTAVPSAAVDCGSLSADLFFGRSIHHVPRYGLGNHLWDWTFWQSGIVDG
jgi:hypothetical protein